MRWIALSFAVVLITAGCAREPQVQQTPPDTMTPVAEAAYNPSMFDTITWESQDAALERGQTVYTYSCAKCHGPEGLGDAGVVTHGDTLRPPSFQDPGWRFADDKEGLRQQVFVGTAKDMPHWGLEGLKPRDVDAVAIFIINGLRSK